VVQRGHGLLCSCRTPHSLPSEPTSRPMPTTPRPPARRAVIIGAGAIGSHLAASLRDGTPLLIIDPSAGVRSSFAARGTDSVCPTADLSSLPESDPRHIRNGDVVVLATCASVATRAVANVPEAVPVICLANGLPLSAQRGTDRSHTVSGSLRFIAPGRAWRRAQRTAGSRLSETAATTQLRSSTARSIRRGNVCASPRISTITGMASSCSTPAWTQSPR